MSAATESPDDFSFNDLSQQPSNDHNSNPSRTGSESAPKEQDQAPKLKRIACVLCRKRKLRCDGARPTCGTCKRLKHDCAYDEIRKKSGPKRGYVKQLEARLQQVETLLKTQENEPARDQRQTDGPSIQLDTDPTTILFQPPPPGGISPGEQFLGQGDAMSEEPFQWEVIGLGLDEPLPLQEDINELNQIYFSKVHPSLPLIHRPRFYAAMSLAPFMRPPVCLRYAMWALAACSSDKYEALQEHFYQRARKYIQLDEMRGHGESVITLGHCQAWVLLATYEFKQMYFPRAWLSIGRAVRLSQMMMLHRLDGTGLDVKQVLPPPKDWTEREERRRTFWSCFCVDRYASIGTGWPMTIEEKDILTNLPASEEAFEKSKPAPSSTLEEAMLPNGVANLSSFAGVCLMAACFGRNLTHLHRPTPEDREDDLNGEFWKRHRQMDGVLLNTHLALPDSLRMPMAISDSNAIYLQMSLHTSVICLHQAAIYKADKHRLPQSISNESKVRCMTAAAEIASLMRMISHLDLASMNPFISFSVYVAARVFVQWLKNRPKDQQVLSSLQFLLQAMHALKKRNPLTESFMVQLDLDLESIGIPGLRAGLDPNEKRVSEVPLNYDVAGCAPIYEIRESQNPSQKVIPTAGFGASTSSSSAAVSPGPFPVVTGSSNMNMDMQNASPFGYVAQNTAESPAAARQRQQSQSVRDHMAQHGRLNPELLKNPRGIIIPIISGSSTEPSEMDTSPDASGTDHATPSSGSIHRSNSTSFSPPGGGSGGSTSGAGADESRSPNPHSTPSGSVSGVSGVNVPSSTSAGPSPNNAFFAPDDDFASLAAQFYSGPGMSSGAGADFSMPVNADWGAGTGGAGGVAGVTTGMSPLSGSSWGQMLDVTGMGWDGVGEGHGAGHWGDGPLRSR